MPAAADPMRRANKLTDQAVEEMHRKPDAHMALELIERLTTDPNVVRVCDAYFEAGEE